MSRSAPSAPVVAPRPSPTEARPSARLRPRRNKAAAVNPEIVRLELPDPTGLEARYGVPHETQGPRVRLGAAWAVAVALALAIRPLRPFGLAIAYGVAAGFAAMGIIDAHRDDDRMSADRWVAALGASTLPVLATLGARALGGGLIAIVIVAVGMAMAGADPRTSVLDRASQIVAAAAICGGAAASVVLLADYEIGAVIILLVFVMVYDASDFLIGSGATNAVEGPLAGALAVAATALVFTVVHAPPFRGGDVWWFALLAMVAFPAGQVVASALLPQARTRVPALRRLDSLLVAAPLWAALVGLYL